MEEKKFPNGISGKLQKMKAYIKDNKDKLNLKDINLKEIDKNNEKVRKALALFMAVVIAGMGFTGYKVNEIRTRAFDIYIGQDKIGSVRDKDEALEIMDEIQSDLSHEYNLDIVLDNKLNFEKTHIKNSGITNGKDIKQNIKSSVGFLVSGYAIEVNGEQLGVVKSKREAEYVLDKIKEPYLRKINKDSKIKEVKLVEDIKMVKTQAKLNDISKQDELIKYIRTGAQETKTHIVEVGESFWTIARMYDTTVEDLVAANPDSNPSKLKPGDKVSLTIPTSKITVATVEEVQYSEKLNYDVEVEENSSMYTNEKKVKVKGVPGESKIVADEVKHNGMLIEKNVVKEEIVKEPTTEVVIKGTKPVPKTAATGVFLMPTRGRISSRYGMRNGRMHRGLDIANRTGNSINAADGGTVTFAGYKGTYGYLVEIDHGNGYKSRYAHCSKLLVKRGDKVYKGQRIANIGNTGRSTGPHLHLEIIKNGVHQNPINYVR